MKTSSDTIEQEQAGDELEKALIEIKRSETELRTIVDALPAHAWASRSDGYNIFCNQQWLDYSGFTQETTRGWTFRDIIHPDDLDPFVKNWTELSAIGAPVEAEVRFRRFDGEYRWFLIRALPVRDENGKTIKWFGTNTDIDDRKKAEALLAGENKIPPHRPDHTFGVGGHRAPAVAGGDTRLGEICARPGRCFRSRTRAVTPLRSCVRPAAA